MHPLKVFNRIYEEVFNLAWVSDELFDIRPYARKLDAWIASGCQDEICLLQGEELDKILVWADNRDLPEQDHRFIKASQVLERKKEQQKTELAKQEAQEASDRLARTKRRTKQVVWAGATVATILLVISTALGYAAKKSFNDYENARLSTDWEQQSSEILKQFDFDQLGALLSAMRLGREVQTKTHNGYLTKDYSALSPVLVLREILFKIQEQNRLTLPKQGWIELIKSLKSVGFSPDGKQSFAFDFNTLYLFDQSGRLIKKQSVPTGNAIHSIAFTTDGVRFLTSTTDSLEELESKTQEIAIRLWDLSGNKLAEFYLEHDLANISKYNEIIISPNGKQVAIIGLNTVKILGLSGKKLLEAKGNSIDFSANGKHIVIGGQSGVVQLWNSDYRKVLEFNVGGEPKELNNIIQVGFSADGQQINTYTSGQIVQFWNLAGKPTGGFGVYRSDSPSTPKVIFSSDNTSIASFYSDDTVILWSRSGQQLTQIKQKRQENSVEIYAALSPNQKQMLISSGNVLSMWDYSAKLKDLSKQPLSQFIVGRNINLLYPGIAFSPEGNQIIIPSYGKTRSGLPGSSIQFWSLTGQKLNEVEGNLSENKTITVTRVDGTIDLLALTGQQIASFKKTSSSSWQPRFSSNGKKIATFDSTNVDLWSKTGEHIAQLKVEKVNPAVLAGVASPMQFSPDAAQVATLEDGCVRLWSYSGQPQAKLFHEKVRGMEFSPDSKHIKAGRETLETRVYSQFLLLCSISFVSQPALSL